MGAAYDLDRVQYNARCSDVKEAVILITYIGIFFSGLFLISGIIRMLIKKNKYKRGFSFITEIIIFIFFSELLNIISKSLQFLKYAFKDTREDESKNDIETPRGVICQIQILLSIISDFCTLLGTFLLSYRCYEVIKSKSRIFDKKKAKVLSFFIIIIFSVIISLVFLFVDRYLTRDLFSIKFDLRDRCSYWCWLEHKTSIVCYGLYAIILIINVIFVFKVNTLLRKAYDKLKEQSLIFVQSDNANTLNDNNNSNDNSEGKRTILSEDKERIKELKMMRIKSRIYPIVTIIIWAFLALYRFSDDIMMMEVDNYYDQSKSQDGESQYFKDNEVQRIFEEINLVTHTILSTFRGIAYGLCFIIFEERFFGDCFKNKCNKFCLCICCGLNDDLDDWEETDYNSGLKSDSPSKGPLYNSIGKESNEEEQNLMKINEDEIQRNNEMNNSNYNFND